MQGVILRAYSLALMKSIDCEQKLKSETLRNVRAQVTDLEPFKRLQHEGEKLFLTSWSTINMWFSFARSLMFCHRAASAKGRRCLCAREWVASWGPQKVKVPEVPCEPGGARLWTSGSCTKPLKGPQGQIKHMCRVHVISIPHINSQGLEWCSLYMADDQ